MSKEKHIPITRINKFFGHEDFNLEVEMGREAIEGDGNFVVILYRVDRENTESDDVYNEAVVDGIGYFPPIELRVQPTLRTPENKAYNKSDGSLRYLEDGQLTFGIYDDQLQELDTDISYGDYIGFPVSETEIRYFSVVNDGRKNYDNAHTMMGYKGYARTVLCAPVNPDEFKGF
jgi:hypothetical protein